MESCLVILKEKKVLFDVVSKYLSTSRNAEQEMQIEKKRLELSITIDEYFFFIYIRKV